MKKFLTNIILLFLVSLVIGEVIVRVTHAVSEIPQRTIDKHGIQKYLPNQEGYWKGGKHRWTINKLGWPGELPKSYDNLILVIGDSYIENFMNPNECHQSVFLKEYMQDYNFMEVGRSGVSFIEAMEISKNMDSLRPIQTLIYVNDEDFYESISEVKPMRDITQLNIRTSTIQYGEMKAPMLKKALYTWKLSYYFYNRFHFGSMGNTEVDPQNPIEHSKEENLKFPTEISQLIEYINRKYIIETKTLVFHPDSNKSIIELCINAGFDIILLDSNSDDSWSFDYDNHWTCYGHKRAARQVSNKLLNSTFKDSIR